MSHVSETGTQISTRKHLFGTLVNGLVCKKCNNGWMSLLETECQSHVVSLMNLMCTDDELKLALMLIDRELMFLNENSFVVAKWAFKNAILLNWAVNYRKLVPREHFRLLYKGQIPQGVHIDLAFTSDCSPLSWRQSSSFSLTKPSGMSFDPQGLNKCYKITFQLRSLLIKVVYFTSVINSYYEDDGAISLFPAFGAKGRLAVFDSIDHFDTNGVIHEHY